MTSLATPAELATYLQTATLAEAEAGSNGFGYDPIFVADGFDVTTAELSPRDKDAISHRGQAVRAFVDWLKEA